MYDASQSITTLRKNVAHAPYKRHTFCSIMSDMSTGKQVAIGVILGVSLIGVAWFLAANTRTHRLQRRNNRQINGPQVAVMQDNGSRDYAPPLSADDGYYNPREVERDDGYARAGVTDQATVYVVPDKMM